MRLFVFGEVHENLSPVRIGNVVGKVFEELMRAALQIHRDIQGIDIARFVFDLDLQQFFLRKDFFYNLSGKSPRRSWIESGLSMYFWSARRKGRAPNAGS